MEEETLREKARAVIESGKLPSRTPDRTWGGPGVGASCAICDLPVRNHGDAVPAGTRWRRETGIHVMAKRRGEAERR